MSETVELNWQPKTYISNVGCYIAAIGDGFLIASAEIPRFCFHAETEEAARVKAQRAIAFWKIGRNHK